MYMINIYLVNSANATYFVNAAAWYDRDVQITFNSRDVASNLMRLLRSEAAQNGNLQAFKKSQTAGVAKQVARDVDEAARDQSRSSGPTKRAINEDGNTAMLQIATQATSLLSAKEQTPTSAPQPISQHAQLHSQHRKSQGLARSQSIEGGVVTAPEAIDLNIAHDIGTSSTKKSKIPQKPSKGDLTGAGALKRSPNTGDNGLRPALSKPLSVTAEVKPHSITEAEDQVFQGSKRRKLVQQLEDDDGQILNVGQSRSDANRRMEKPKALPAPPKKQTNVLETSNDDQRNKFHERGKKGEEQDLYELPTSPQLPRIRNISAKCAPGPVNEDTPQSQNTGHVVGKAHTHNKASTKPTAPLQAPKPLAQPKSRRAAAIHANEKIHGIDNSNPHDQTRKGHNDTKRKKLTPQANGAVKSNDVNAGAQRDSIETVDTADVANHARRRPMQDSIETVEGTKAGQIQCDRTQSKTAVARSERAGGRRIQDAGAPQRSDDVGFVTPALVEAAKKPDKKENPTKMSAMGFQQVNEGAGRATARQPDPESGDQEVWRGDDGDMPILFDRSENAPPVKAVRPMKATADETTFIEDTAKHHRHGSKVHQLYPRHSAKTTPKKVKEASVSRAPWNVGNGRTAVSKNTGNATTEGQDCSPSNLKADKVAPHREASNLITGPVTNEKKLHTPSKETKNLPGRSLLHKEQGQVASHHLQTQDSQVKGPVKKPKRKVNGEFGSTAKKLKIDVQEATGSRSLERKTPPLASRKTAIISFSISGPRNQGNASKDQASKHSTKTLTSRMVEPANVRRKITDAPKGTRPEETVDILEEAEPVTFDVEVQPPTCQQHRSSKHANIERLGSKPSSQTTRVNHNGSPMPTRHPTNELVFNPPNSPLLGNNDQHDLTREQFISNEREMFLVDVDDDEEEGEGEGEGGRGGRGEVEVALQPQLPPGNDVSQASMPQPDSYEWVNMSKNSKQIPSSPHEPSVISSLPAHHMYLTGEIVNYNTKEPIIPSNPQDPFMDQAARPSSFIRLLQHASEKGTKQSPEAATYDKSKKAKKTTVSFVEDPDKTLVEPSLPSRKTKCTNVEDLFSSSSSEETSEEEPSRTLVEEAVEDTPTQWNKALQPYRQNTLDVLTEISHRLVAHMTKSEDDFLDLVLDFKKQGNLLIDHLEKELELQNAARAAAMDALRKKMNSLYKEICAELERNADRMIGRTRLLEDKWQTHRNLLLASVDDALAACAT